MPNIVILDAMPLNPGDLSWEALKNIGGCQIYDRTAPEQVVERCENADMVLTNKVKIPREAIEQLAKLKYIGVLATGYDVIDIKAASEKNIVVTNIPNYSTMSVAQQVFALLLEITHRVGHHAKTVQQQKWAKSADFSYWDYPLIELANLNFGIIGFGTIGQAVSKIALAFGMNVFASKRTLPKNPDPNIHFTSINEILQNCDVISLHCPLTEQTKHLINTESLKLMKPSCILINTGRGPLIDESALYQALKNKTIAAAGLDVLSQEPPQENHPLTKLDNCIISPHFAWATFAARKRLMDIVIKNIQGFLAGEKINVVN